MVRAAGVYGPKRPRFRPLLLRWSVTGLPYADDLKALAALHRMSRLKFVALLLLVLVLAALGDVDEHARDAVLPSPGVPETPHWSMRGPVG